MATSGVPRHPASGLPGVRDGVVGKKGKPKGKAKSRARGPAHDAFATSAPHATGVEPGTTGDGVPPTAGRPTDVDGRVAPGAAKGSTRRMVRDAAPPAATDLAARWVSLSTVLQRQLGRSDEEDGLTRARLSALALLVLGGPRRLGELAAGEGVRPPTMTRLVQAMEADGLVTREVDPTDRRSIIVRATVQGEALLHDGRARRLAPLAAAMSRLPAEGRLVLGEAADLLAILVREANRAGTAEEPAGR